MLTVRWIEPDRVSLQWNNLLGDTFSVYRSEAEHSGFTLLAQGLTIPLFNDDENLLWDDGTKFFYQVKGISSGGTVLSTSEVVTLMYNQKDLVSNKIMHEYQVVLRIMGNPPLHLFIRKQTGDKCTNCWNPITKKIRFADCPTCKGTGNAVGYYPSIPISVSTDVSQQMWDPSFVDSNKTTLNPISAWTMNTPLVHPGDIVADILGRRYIVTLSVPRTKSQYVIRQMMQLSPLNNGHPSYSLIPSE